MKKQLGAVGSIGLLSILFLSSADAALLSRLGGLAVYDTDLDITWLADANAGAGSVFDDGFSSTDGRMSWANALAWADSLTVGGFTDWRLPTTLVPDATCSNSNSTGTNCSGSEMGHLFYDELGGTALQSILTSTDPDLALFTNIQPDNYWSMTDFAPVSASAWIFYFNTGGQNPNFKGSSVSAWAVRTGDVSEVPVPSVVWLVGSVLIATLGTAMRNRGSNF